MDPQTIQTPESSTTPQTASVQKPQVAKSTLWLTVVAISLGIVVIVLATMTVLSQKINEKTTLSWVAAYMNLKLFTSDQPPKNHRLK